MLIGSSVALLATTVLILALVLAKRGLFSTPGVTELDVNAAQAGVQQILTDPINGYGRDDVTDVRCNHGRNPIVKAGNGFTCDVTVAGVKRQVQVVFSDNTGTYAVDRPR